MNLFAVPFEVLPSLLAPNFSIWAVKKYPNGLGFSMKLRNRHFVVSKNPIAQLAYHATQRYQDEHASEQRSENLLRLHYCCPFPEEMFCLSGYLSFKK